MTVEGKWNLGIGLPPRSDCPAYAFDTGRYCGTVSWATVYGVLPYATAALFKLYSGML